MRADATAKSSAPAQVEPRIAYLNDAERNAELIATKQYAKNVIVTSKYTAASFLPKTMFEFFRVVANVYFLVISLLQLLTTWSPTNRFTTAGPLAFVLMVTMLKQGSEDIKRHNADEHQNNRTCRIVNASGATETITWQALQVGQLLCVRNNEELPADIVILATSEEEGRCFIETCNLDGETNLKRRAAVQSTAKIAGWRDLNAPVLDEQPVCAGALLLCGSLEYEQPNNQLYTFTGRLLLGPTTTTSPLGPENVLLRGCGLRSCDFVIGVVIFTGAETKLLQNSRTAPSKQSKLYKMVNRCMLLIFSTMAALCLVSAVVAAVWDNAHAAPRVWYLPFIHASSAPQIVENVFTFLILFNNLVPISLYVSLDIIKVLQAKNIAADDAMCLETFRAIARTSELNEELGQIEYIFSDKTGTLTCNVMEFRKCSIAGTVYGFGTTEIGRAVAAMGSGSESTNGDVNLMSTAAVLQERTVSVAPLLDATSGVASSAATAATAANTKMNPLSDPRRAQVYYDPTISFDDPGLLRALYASSQTTNARDRIHEFLTLLSICHTVIPEVNKATGTITYRASSPDEEALVKAAKCLGYNFIDPAPLMKIEITPKNLQTNQIEPDATQTVAYTVLNVNEFNSTRKRMSIVALNAQHEFVLYCKGADNMMLPRTLADEYTAAVTSHLRLFANEGLRTLVLARRVLSRDEYEVYNTAYIEASTALVDREAKLDAVADSIETNMTLLGVTAIEDKLQDFVPSTIYDLAQAGIKIWVLTGDREETAVNIGHACRLLNDRMQLLYVNEERIIDLVTQLDELFNAPFIQQLIQAQRVSDEIAIVCDGKALVHVFPSKDVRAAMTDDAAQQTKALASKLLAVASVCKALIACRVSPSQKAEIVSLVRYGVARAAGTPQPITLAIGDGANDVSMIQTAHVGVGISGKEGVQAVNASDYAIAQFSFLKRLMLIHGRFNYKRICKVIKYSFYKNIALVISLFLYNFVNGQSGAPLFESFVMAGWNFFLATPIIVIGVYDQDMPEMVVLKFPRLYAASQRDCDLNLRVFAATIANAIVHALICFSVCYLCADSTLSLFHMGTIFYTMLLLTMKWKVLLLTLSWNAYHFWFLAFSVALFGVFLLTYPLLTFLSYDMYGVPSMMLRGELFWALLGVCPLAAIVLDYTLLTLQQQFMPTSEDILRERYRMNASIRMSGKAGILPDNAPSSSFVPSTVHVSSAVRNHNAAAGAPLVFPDVLLPGANEARSLTQLESQLRVSSVHSVGGFAFNGPDSSAITSSGANRCDSQDLITKRVNTFASSQRSASITGLDRTDCTAVDCASS